MMDNCSVGRSSPMVAILAIKDIALAEIIQLLGFPTSRTVECGTRLDDVQLITQNDLTYQISMLDR